MIRTHLLYLRRCIGFAASMKGTGNFMKMINVIHAANTPVYQMIRDIVCDSRFYTFIGHDETWKEYSEVAVMRFIDSLTPQQWDNEEVRTGLKEDFLNDWFAKHLFPLSESELAVNTPESDAEDEVAENYNDDEFDYLSLYEIMESSGTAKDETDKKAPGIKPSAFPSEELQAYASRVKNEQKQGESDPHTAEACFLKSIHRSIFDLAMKIGRAGGSISFESKGKFQTARRSDISGITTGDNLNALLPTELALLGNSATENIFYQKFAQKKLQIFSSQSHSTEAKEDKPGPIYICIDTSGSMTGVPEVIAKTLALAISIVAQKDKRPICLINYSDDVSFFVLTNLEAQKNQFLRFLSLSYSGGNNENMLFDFIFNQLPREPKYNPFANNFHNADMLVISDFMWTPIVPKIMSLVNKAKDDGMRIFSLSVNETEIKEMEDIEESFSKISPALTSGLDFFKASNFPYQYSYYLESILQV